MVLRVTDTSLTIEATDPDIIKAAKTAAEALGDQADPPGTIRGDLPDSATLGGVWLALNASLENIRRRATVAKARRGGAARPAQPGERAAQGRPGGAARRGRRGGLNRAARCPGARPMGKNGAAPGNG